MLYPIQSESRTVQSLNGIWNFILEDSNEIHDPSMPIKNPQSMAVPGSFND